MKTHPKDETETDDESDLAATRELQSIAQQIEEWRGARPDLTKAELLRRYPDLGDDRTFGRCVKGDTAEINVTKWLVNYRQVASLIELESDPDDELDDKQYDDLSGPMKTREAFLEVARERGNQRCGIILGWPGTGKTACREALERKYGDRVRSVEASRLWQNTKNNDGTARPLLRAILTRLGTTPSNRWCGDELLNTTLDKLNEKRIGLLVDEAHHLCADGIDALKSIINGSRGEVVLFGHPQLWDQLASKAYAQCRQLTTNRLKFKFRLGFNQGDVRTLIERRVPGCDNLAKAAQLMHKEANTSGKFSFVRSACSRARRLMREKQTEVASLAIISAAVNAELKARDEI